MKTNSPVITLKPKETNKVVLIDDKKEKEESAKENFEERDDIVQLTPAMFDKFNNPFILKKIVIILGVVIIIGCISFAVYQFYSKRSQLKVELCQQEKIDAYETKITELTQHIEVIACENNNMNAQIAELQTANKELEEQKKKTEYESKPQAVFRTTKKGKKQHHVEQLEDDGDEETNEFTVEHPKFDDAPITKQKKKVNPQQALKSHINEAAKKSYDRKQSMIQQQMDNDREDEEEREQFEIQKQLGLSREINDEKLMELAEEQANAETNVRVQHTEDLEEVVGIDESLIA